LPAHYLNDHSERAVFLIMDPRNQLDVRVPIGVLFFLSIVLLLFGGIMLAFGWRDSARHRPDASD
jgi:hypothetical protein